MKRTFVLTDIHGQYTAMDRLLHHVNFSPQADQLIVVGDLIDRGPDSALVVKTLKQFQERFPENIHVIFGNHELMLKWYMYTAKSHMWLRHGGLETIESFNKVFPSEEEKDEYRDWLRDLPFFYETDHYVFVHAGFDPFYVLSDQPEDTTFMSLKELYRLDDAEFKSIIGSKKIVHGHTPYLHVYQTNRFISCDTGASVLNGHALSLVELNSETVYMCNTQTNEITLTGIPFKTNEWRLQLYEEERKKK